MWHCNRIFSSRLGRKAPRVFALLMVLMVLLTSCGNPNQIELVEETEQESSLNGGAGRRSDRSRLPSVPESETESESSIPADRGKAGSDPLFLFGVVLSSHSVYSDVLLDGMQNVATKHNLELTLQDAQWDIAKQVSMIESLIAAGADALIIDPIDADALAPVMRLANEVGIPVVSIFREAQEANCSILFDYKQAGALCAQDMLLRPEGGNIVLLDIPISSAQEYNNGFLEYLDSAADGHYTPILFKPESLDSSAVLPLIEDMVRTDGNIAGGAFFDTTLAAAAVAALEAAGLPEIPVYTAGFEADFEYLGVYGMAAFPAENAGVAACDIAYRLCQGESVEQIILLPSELITG